MQSPVNLELTRLFATTGEIPRLAAQALGRPADEGPVLAAALTVEVDPEVEAMRSRRRAPTGTRQPARRTPSREAVKEFLRSRSDVDRSKEVTDLQARLTDLQDRILALQRRLATSTLETPVLQAQQDALGNQYRVDFERLQVLQAQAAATSPLDTLEEAVPIPVIATGSPGADELAAVVSGMAAVLGLVLGIGLALAVDRLDNRVRTRQEVERVTGLAVVAEIPPLRQAAAGRAEGRHRDRARQRRRRGLPRPARRRAAGPEPQSPRRARAPALRPDRRGGRRRCCS